MCALYLFNLITYIYINYANYHNIMNEMKVEIYYADHVR